MTMLNPAPEVADEVPWIDGITEYDNQHNDTYIQPYRRQQGGPQQGRDGPAHSRH